jgi:pyrimidine-nucleoside phosphorylase
MPKKSMTCSKIQDSQSLLFDKLPQTIKEAFFLGAYSSRGHITDPVGSEKTVTYFSHNCLDGKASLALAPLLASAGLTVPKIIWPSQAEGQCLQIILSSISGMKLTLAPDEMRSCLVSQGAFFASAPKSSAILHDELAVSVKSAWQLFSLVSLLILRNLNIKAAIYDIKINDSDPGFDIHGARRSILALKDYAGQLGTITSYFLSYQQQFLGQALGPVLELIEALEILKGRGPHDIKKMVLEQAADLLLLAHKAANRTEAKSTLKSLIIRGDALKKIEDIITGQGGNSHVVNDYAQLPRAKHKIAIRSLKTGFVTRIKAINLAALRDRLTGIHPGAGFLLQMNVGDSVRENDVVIELHFPEPRCSARLQDEIRDAIVLDDRPPNFMPLIAEKIKDTS